MGCGEFLVKYILFFANLVFAVAGLTLIGLGIATLLHVKEIVQIAADANLEVAPISAIVVGSIIFIVAFFGCCGAIRESNCMLVTYSIFMLVMMIAMLALAILIFVKLDDVIQQIPKWLSDFFATDKQSFQTIETAFKCCGPAGAISYASLSLPNTCCATAPCIIAVNAYSGCNTIVQEFFHTYGLVIGVVAIIVVAIELVAAVFGLCLANHVRNKDRRARY